MKDSRENNIIIFKSEDGPKVIVQIGKETIWLSQAQMAELFDKDSDTISLHIKNIFQSEELLENSTTEDFSVVRQEGSRKVKRKIKYYNLDVIISVGYRVNSKRGTQFRIWANRILKDYLLQGYALNEQALQMKVQKIEELEKTIQSIVGAASKKSLSDSEAQGVLKVIEDYTLALDLLDKYDHQKLRISYTNKSAQTDISLKGAMEAIDQLREKFRKDGEVVDLFGKEKDKSFRSSISTIYQTFDGKELYPSIEEKASHLLYFVIKNHSFVDGNKRIAAFMFVWFLEKNNYLYTTTGKKRIEDNGLVALCLLIAHSKPEEKDTFIKLTVNLINKKNS